MFLYWLQNSLFSLFVEQFWSICIELLCILGFHLIYGTNNTHQTHRLSMGFWLAGYSSSLLTWSASHYSSFGKQVLKEKEISISMKVERMDRWTVLSISWFHRFWTWWSRVDQPPTPAEDMASQITRLHKLQAGFCTSPLFLQTVRY